MKDCSVFIKGLCLGCTGLTEPDWAGSEQCNTYKQLNNVSGLDICKTILQGGKNDR